jgi:hypothetical protein
MNKKIFDYFTYYDPTGQEMLKLRYSILKDYVHKFVICESSRTSLGDPIPYKVKDRIIEFGLPLEKFIIIANEIPDDEHLDVLSIDIFNSYENKNMHSFKARARERMQKNGIHNVLNLIDDDAFIIVSDIDEIINPKNLDFITNFVSARTDFVIKIPLMYMEGKANLRIYYKDPLRPKPWDGAMFICTKQHLSRTKVGNIRSSAFKNLYCPLDIQYLVQDGKRIEDMGWHFSWIGNSQRRREKLNAFTHRDETYGFLTTKSYNSQEFLDSLDVDPYPGRESMSGESGTILVLVSNDLLPAELTENPEFSDFFMYTPKNPTNL